MIWQDNQIIINGTERNYSSMSRKRKQVHCCLDVISSTFKFSKWQRSHYSYKNRYIPTVSLVSKLCTTYLNHNSTIATFWAHLFASLKPQLTDSTVRIKPNHRKTGTIHNWRKCTDMFAFLRNFDRNQNLTISRHDEEPYNAELCVDVGH